MKRLVLALSIVAFSVAGPHAASACSYCDPDLTADDIEQGFYIVTKAYVGDTVTTTGDLTTYGIQTVDVAPTTVARDASVVQSGQPSALDGTSMNPRPALSDGRPVGGTYVDSFRIDAGGTKVFIGRTFLADDSELAKDAARIATGAVAPAEVAVPAPAPAAAPEAPQPPAPVAPDPVTSTPDTAAPAEVTIPALVGVEPDAPPERDRRPSEPGEDGPFSPGGSTPPSPSPHDVRAAVALAPQADPLVRIEVLRGRRVALWIRGTVDGTPARILFWRLVSGEVSALGPLSGAGDDPFVGQWLAMARAGDAFVVRFDAVVEVRGGSARSVPATIAVTVRAPALVE